MTSTTMPLYTQSKRHLETAKLFKQFAAPRAAPQPQQAQAQVQTPEQKAKIQAYEARKAASNAAVMASLRAANPKQEIATGSPYQAAREAWLNTDSTSTGAAFDHWTSNKD
jgi:hypothetical protein